MERWPLKLVAIKSKKMMRRKARLGEVKENKWLVEGKRKKKLKQQAEYSGSKSLAAKGARRE